MQRASEGVGADVVTAHRCMESRPEGTCGQGNAGVFILVHGVAASRSLRSIVTYTLANEAARVERGLVAIRQWDEKRPGMDGRSGRSSRVDRFGCAPIRSLCSDSGVNNFAAVGTLAVDLVQ